jgi:hypothetical protein
VAVTENQVYYWRAQAFDGALRSEWMAAAAFLVNTANDAPGAPQLLAPAEGSTLETLSPTLVVANAFDPDSDALSYDFELYQGGALVAVFNGVAQGDGTTSVTLGTALTDRSLYTWRVRAFDGDSYGPWTAMGSFKVQVRQDELAVQIKFVPETLNKRDKGQWVKVDILLPPGYRGQDIDLASIRLAGVVPVDTAAPVTRQDNLATVRFNRSAVSAVLPAGPDVPVTITGVDLIKVLDK